MAMKNQSTRMVLALCCSLATLAGLVTACSPAREIQADNSEKTADLRLGLEPLDWDNRFHPQE